MILLVWLVFKRCVPVDGLADKVVVWPVQIPAADALTDTLSWDQVNGENESNAKQKKKWEM